MALELAERRDVDFVLYEQLGLDKLIEHDRFAEFNKKTLDLIVTEARTLAVKELLPANVPGDPRRLPLRKRHGEGARGLSADFRTLPGRGVDCPGRRSGGGRPGAAGPPPHRRFMNTSTAPTPPFACIRGSATGPANWWKFSAPTSRRNCTSGRCMLVSGAAPCCSPNTRCR